MAPPSRRSTCCGRDSMISRVSWCTPSSHCQWKERTVRSATARDTLVDLDGPVCIEKQLVDSRHQCRSSLGGVERCRIGDVGRASRPHRSLRWAPERLDGSSPVSSAARSPESQPQAASVASCATNKAATSNTQQRCSSPPSCTAEGCSSAGRKCIQPSCRRIVWARQLVGPLPSPVAGRARRPFWLRPCVLACGSVAGRGGAEWPSGSLTHREAAPTIEPAAIEP